MRTSLGRASASSPERRSAMRDAAGREVLLFRIAVGVIAAHAAVDSFVAPEPGTSAGDHLLRGLVSLALLAVAGVGYPRPASRRSGSARCGTRRARPRRSAARNPRDGH